MAAFSVIMPAFNAGDFIHHAVGSVVAQSYGDWELWLISDDGVDYEAVLAAKGIRDRRIRHLSSGKVKGGSTRARNIVLDLLDSPYAGVLDADDRFHPAKLGAVVRALEEQPIVTVSLSVTDPHFRRLRTVGEGTDKVLTAGQHKWVNFSMDSMVSWDRRICDGRYDPDLPNMTDLDFLMRLYRTSAASMHLGRPLHDYVKMPVSMSNGPGVTERMIGVKTLLLERLRSGFYPMADPAGVDGISAFLEVSLDAEKTYPAKAEAHPGMLFEDGIEPMLAAAQDRAASTSRA